MTSLTRSLLAVVLVSVSGCAGNYYQKYKASHPDWFPVIPATDIGLEETVAALYAPPRGGYQLIVDKLRILQTDVSPWREISLAELESGAFVPSDSHDYAVAALVWCASEVDLERYTGSRPSWYLLPKNRVAFYDHYDFAERCANSNTYLPATGDAVELERRLTREVTSSFTAEPMNRVACYEKGLALAKVGRWVEAEQMLAEGDGTSDPTLKSPQPRFDPGRSVNIASDDEVAVRRKQLVDALRAAPQKPAEHETH